MRLRRKTEGEDRQLPHDETSRIATWSPALAMCWFREPGALASRYIDA